METRRWINQTQPQTLQIAVFLLYLNAAFTLLFGADDTYHLLFGFNVVRLLRLLLPVAGAAAGYGIANERKWGWYLGVGLAALPLVVLLYICVKYQVSPVQLDLLNVLFKVALFVLLIHPQSREYERIWFK